LAISDRRLAIGDWRSAIGDRVRSLLQARIESINHEFQWAHLLIAKTKGSEKW